MRSLLFALLSCILSLPLLAADQLITVTPQNLAGWSVAGVDRNVIAAGKQLILPGNAQLSREFPAGAVIVHLVSRPVFSEEPAQWPVIGVGSGALALVQKEGRGRFMLVLNEATVTELPWSVPLDGKEVPVDLILAYDPLSGAGLIGFQDQVQDFSVPVSARSVDVWLSAGQASAWPQDLMQVMLLTGDPADGATANTKPTTSTKQSQVNRLESAMGILRANAATSGESAPRTASPVQAVNAVTVSTLEIFTPPSVRRTKIIEAVRATVAQSQGK